MGIHTSIHLLLLQQWKWKYVTIRETSLIDLGMDLNSKQLRKMTQKFILIG